MTAEEEAAWVSMARDGSLADVLIDTSESGNLRYLVALRARVELLRKPWL